MFSLQEQPPVQRFIACIDTVQKSLFSNAFDVSVYSKPSAALHMLL